MQAFEYTRPQRAGQAVALLGDDGHEGRGAVPMAGGSDLFGLMKDGAVTPGRLVDVRDLAEAAGAARGDDGGLVLGAATTVGVLAQHPALAADYPALAKAFRAVASPQIRNVGTLGGNLCQRPRCWYFRLGYGLLAQRDGRSMVLDGDHRYHAVLGNDGPAYFVSPSTVAPLLIGYGAEVETQGPDGGRRFPVAELYRTPRAEGESELSLAPGEIVLRLHLPPAAGRVGASYEVRQRKSLDWSLATASVVLRLDGGRVADARIVLGQVAPTPWRAGAAEAALAGETVDGDSAAAAARAAVEGARSLGRNGYKIQLARTAVQRALLAAAGKEV